jgi:hypothetical protein
MVNAQPSVQSSKRLFFCENARGEGEPKWFMLQLGEDTEIFTSSLSTIPTGFGLVQLNSARTSLCMYFHQWLAFLSVFPLASDQTWFFLLYASCSFLESSNLQNQSPFQIIVILK